VPDMLRYRRHAGGADVHHFQWLPLEALDAFLLPNARPRVMTLHNVRRRGAAGNTRRLAERMDALVVHTHDAAELLDGELGVDPAKVHVIPHGAFEHLTRQNEEVPLPEELAAVQGPVVLSFGMIRPYKGIDVLLEAFREVEGAELWIVGRRLDNSPLTDLEALARQVPGKVRFVTRYITEPEIPAFLRRADIVALPYRTIDQSGVLYTALAFGKPLVMSAVGGFVEVGEGHGAGVLVPPGEPQPLAEAIRDLLADPARRAELGERAAAAAAGPYSWDGIAKRTLALYEDLVG
jgi:glycosyltransferase involved in cell wall biosynthesis